MVLRLKYLLIQIYWLSVSVTYRCKHNSFTAMQSNLLGDIAVDWIADVLYWVDSSWARIEVLDLDNLNRTELLRTGPNTNPSAIAVDPRSR